MGSHLVQNIDDQRHGAMFPAFSWGSEHFPSECVDVLVCELLGGGEKRENVGASPRI